MLSTTINNISTKTKCCDDDDLTTIDEDFNPWPGLTLACMRILQLYAKVFEQDLPPQLAIRYIFNPVFYCFTFLFYLY